jgi:hypothetical protein
VARTQRASDARAERDRRDSGETQNVIVYVWVVHVNVHAFVYVVVPVHVVVRAVVVKHAVVGYI